MTLRPKPPRDPIRIVTPGHPAWRLYMERMSMKEPEYFQAVLRHRKRIRLRLSQINELLARPALIHAARQSAGKDD